MRILIRCWYLGALLFLMAACSAQNGGTSGALKVGMTTDQAIEAMGKPDLTDTIPDPDHAGAPMLRYTWLNAGEAAVFGQNMRVANVVNVGSSPETLTETARQPQNGFQPEFDPLQTPFDYASYPLRAAAVAIFTGLNCVGGNGCHSPHWPPVTPGGAS